jgi:hypothetical protein
VDREPLGLREIQRARQAQRNAERDAAPVRTMAEALAELDGERLVP